MTKITYLFFLIVFFLSNLYGESFFESTKDLPVAYQGRFRSLDSASRLWLYDTYHKQKLKKSDLEVFNSDNSSAMDLLWQIHFLGHTPWDNSPFFWLHYASSKSLLKLDTRLDRFSFNTLYKALYEDQEINISALKILILSEFKKKFSSATNRSNSQKIELKNLSNGLWVTKNNHRLIVTKTPSSSLWQFLKPGMVITDDIENNLINLETNTSEELVELLQQLHFFVGYQGVYSEEQKSYHSFFKDLKKQDFSSNEIAEMMNSRFPFIQRLQAAGTILKMLPVRFSPGEWVSLHAFRTKNYDLNTHELTLSNNFTSFSNEHFFLLREAYFELEKAVISNKSSNEIIFATQNFSQKYQEAYASLAGQSYQKAYDKSLNYPSILRLKAETYYYRLPFIEVTLALYGLGLFLIGLSLKHPQNSKIKRSAIIAIIMGFIIQTIVLFFRCFILQRPPVSNMFETIVYVPWVAVAIGFIFFCFNQSRLVLTAATFASFALLVLLKLTQVDSRLENVQAVLDSQYWLIIHVLMVVGSYGAFFICGVLGHFYLIELIRKKKPTLFSEKIAQGILHTMYIGVALLIPGTILGGVWAAESWGRFWDWDPKESWAFISACVYILFIHAYTFHHIRDFGLAIGSVAGLVAISFTWYGVNYVLGTGLHSYGFGKGGESFYFIYIAMECLFILTAILMKKNQKKLIEKN